MSSSADVRKVKYAPEVLPEVFNTAAVSTGGTDIASYSRFEPFIISINNLKVERGTSLETILTSDGLVASRWHNEGVSNMLTMEEYSRIYAKRDLSLMMKSTSGGAENNIGIAYNLEVRDPSIIDKIRLGMDLTTEEEAIAAVDKLDLRNQDNAGLIPRHPNLIGDEVFNQFDELIMVPRRMPIIAAGGTEDIGSIVNVPMGKVCVLLGIAVDSVAVEAAVDGGDTCVVVDRDGDRNYVTLDATLMPGGAGTVADYMMRMYIPATDKFRVFIKSTTGLAAGLKARFIYGIRKMTILDHLKWSIPFAQRELKDATDTINKYGLTEKVAAGII